jgi:ABC-type transport system involved in multi-copper enzyme maturation permease subunit
MQQQRRMPSQEQSSTFAQPQPSTLLQNPVFQKELKSRLQMRRMPKWAAILVRVGVAAAITLTYFTVISEVFSRDSYERHIDNIAYALMWWMVFFAAILPPALASGSITLEREHKTWNALLLSRLKPREIILGKFWAALLPVWALLPIVLPLGLLTTAMSKDIEWWHLGAGCVFYLSFSAFTTALSLFSSWICKKTSVSNGVSLAFIAAYHVFWSLGIGIVSAFCDKLGIKIPEWFAITGSLIPLFLQPFLTVFMLNMIIKKIHKGAKDSDS